MKKPVEPDLPEPELPDIEIPEPDLPEQKKEDPNTPIQNFMDTKQWSTAANYRSALFDFFDFIMKKRIRKKSEKSKKDIDIPFKVYYPVYEKIALKYLANQRSHAQDVINYAKHLKEAGINPKTSHGRLAAVKEFFSKYHISINEEARKSIKGNKPKMRVSTHFNYIDKKILGEILHHGDARFKAFVLTAASSGARLGEVLNLSWSDIETPNRKVYPDKPTSVRIRDSKTGTARTVYITRETEAALTEWHKVYDNYREYATKRSMNLKAITKAKRNDDKRVFPFTKTSVYRLWDSALNCAGYLKRDTETNRTRMNIHRLRNFYSVQVSGAAGLDVANVFLGHSDRYGGAYSGRSDESWEAEYLKAEPALTIAVQEDPEQKKEVAALKAELAEMVRLNRERDVTLAKLLLLAEKDL